MTKAKKIKNSLQSEFLRNSAFLVGSNAGGQAIALLVYPILTRLYTKDDFGVFTLFLSVAGLLSTLATGKYEEAFVLTKSKDESNALLGFMLKLVFIFSVFLFLILTIAHDYCFTFFDIEAIDDYWYMLPLTVFFTGLFYILTNLANKEKQYKNLASSNLILNSLSSAFKIGLKYITPKSTGLIGGNLLAQAIACLSFFRLKQHIKEALRMGWAQEKEVATRYKDLPLYNMSRNFVTSFSANLPFLVLISIFGEAKLGLLSLALTVTYRPINLVVGSLYMVFSEKTSSLKKENKPLIPLIKTFWTKTICILLPVFIIAFIVAHPLFKYLFGTPWEEAGTYFRYLLPWMFMMLITMPLGFLPVLFDKQRSALWIEIVYLFARWIALYMGIRLGDFNLAIILFSGVGFAYTTVMLVWYLSLAKNRK